MIATAVSQGIRLSVRHLQPGLELNSANEHSSKHTQQVPPKLHYSAALAEEILASALT